MEALGLSQAELARRIGIERRQTIHDWLSGRQEPGAAHLRSLRRELDVTADWLLGFDAPPAYSATWSRFLADLAEEGLTPTAGEVMALLSVVWPGEPTVFGYRSMLATLRAGGVRTR